MYDKEKGAPQGLARYEDLADPKFRGQICARSAAHPYNVSLAASILAADGPEKTEEWARGVVANMARPPQGGDRDQFRAIPAGQCGLAIANTYYLAGIGASERAEDKALFARIGVVFPNQAPGDRGAHVNISGAGLVKTAPNRDAAARFPGRARGRFTHQRARRASLADHAARRLALRVGGHVRMPLQRLDRMPLARGGGGGRWPSARRLRRVRLPCPVRRMHQGDPLPHPGGPGPRFGTPDGGGLSGGSLARRERTATLPASARRRPWPCAIPRWSST